MIISTTDQIPNHEISKSLGIARGSTVRAKNIGNDIFASFKNIVGGEIHEYTKLQADSREEAIQRMIEDDFSLRQTELCVNVSELSFILIVALLWSALWTV